MKTKYVNIVDKRIRFYSYNTILLPSSFRYLKRGIQEFHRKYILVPPDNAETNIVVFIGYTILTLLSRNLMVPRLTKSHLLMRSL